MIITKVANDKEHATALQRIEELMDIPDNDPRMYELLYLSDLVANYEQDQFPTSGLSPIAVLKQLMLEYGLKQKDLAQIFGSKAMVSMILSGKRNMTLDKVQKLSEFFKVPSHLFIEGTTQLNRSAQHPKMDSNLDVPVTYSTILQMIKSTVHEEFEKYLVNNPGTKSKSS